jgi:hypothetical protein
MDLKEREKIISLDLKEREKIIRLILVRSGFGVEVSILYIFRFILVNF